MTVREIKNRKYSELNVCDDFLFKRCMSSIEILKPVLEKIWERKIDTLKEIRRQYHINPAKEY